MTLYLLDANVLIRAHEDYYPVDRIGAFWEWLFGMAEAGVVKMPLEIYGEAAQSPDLRGQWLRRPEVKSAIILAEPTNRIVVADVIAKGYAADLDEVELLTLTRDPFLIAAALGGPDRVVVTRETHKASATRAKRKVPNVCETFGIPWMNDFALWRKLDFRIA